MKLVLLPGLDGTGDLFQPFISYLSPEIDAQVISYSTGKKQNYSELTQHVIEQLPQDDFVLIAESFSGYIAYNIALLNLPNLSSIVFVASFLEAPKPLLLKFSKLLPMDLLLSLPLPNFIIKSFLLDKNATDDLILLVKKSIKKVKTEVLANRLHLINIIGVNDKPITALNVTYLQATNDQLVPKKCLIKFQQIFPQINIHKLKGPHFLLQSKSKFCAKLIQDSLF